MAGALGRASHGNSAVRPKCEFLCPLSSRHLRLVGMREKKGGKSAWLARLGAIILLCPLPASIHVNQFDGTTANSFKPEGEPNHMADARTMMDNAAPYFFRHSENINVCFTDGHAEAFGINKIKNKHPSYGWPYFLTDLYWYPNAPCPGGDQR